MDMILNNNRLNQIIIAIDLEALNFNSLLSHNDHDDLVEEIFTQIISTMWPFHYTTPHD